MKDKDKHRTKQIVNDHNIKSGDDFAWGGNTLKWEEQSKDVAGRYKTYKGKKKYTLK